jgi:chemotaxis protein MotB
MPFRDRLAPLPALLALLAGCATPARLAEPPALLDCRERLAESEGRTMTQQEMLARTRADLDAALSKVAEVEAGIAAERARVEAARAAEQARQARELAAARSALEAQIASGLVQVRAGKDKVVFGLADRVLFPSGRSALTPGGLAALAKVAETIRGLLAGAEADGAPRMARVEGHTDDRPIATARFPSNWDLSASRAASVARFLEASGLRSDQLVVAGFAASWPAASNATPEGRAMNRRIEVALVPAEARPVAP